MEFGIFLIIFLCIIELLSTLFLFDIIGITLYSTILIFDVIYMFTGKKFIESNQIEKLNKITKIGIVLSTASLILWMIIKPALDFRYMLVHGRLREWRGIIVLICNIIYFTKHIEKVEEKESSTDWFFKEDEIKNKEGK